ANEWVEVTPGGTAPTVRNEHSAVWNSITGGLWVFGGGGGPLLSAVDHAYSTYWKSVCEIRFGKANEWVEVTPGGTAPTARYGQRAEWDDAGGRLWIFAGNDDTGAVNDLFYYDLQANAWVEVTPGGATPGVRNNHHSAIDASAGRLYIYGGAHGERGGKVARRVPPPAAPRGPSPPPPAKQLAAPPQELQAPPAPPQPHAPAAPQQQQAAAQAPAPPQLAGTAIPEGGLTIEELEALEEKRKEEAAQAVAAVEAAENNAVAEAIAAIALQGNASASAPSAPGILGEVTISSEAGPVKVAALSLEELGNDSVPIKVSAGETGAELEVSAGLLGEVAAAAGSDVVLLSAFDADEDHPGVAGLPQDAADRLATDDVRAESPDPGPAGAPGAKGPGGARRLASALRSQPLSINFRAADGTKINVNNLTTPMKMTLTVEDPTATCAFLGWGDGAVVSERCADDSLRDTGDPGVRNHSLVDLRWRRRCSIEPWESTKSLGFDQTWN
ncbi:unnamed protein product, partial [Cladocopium goreaui]